MYNLLDLSKFIRNKLNVITKCTLPGVEVLKTNSTDMDYTCNHLNCKYMSIYLDFKYVYKFITIWYIHNTCMSYFIHYLS